MSLHGFSSVTVSSSRKVTRRVVSTYVSTWLSLCHSFYFSQGEKREGFNICLSMVFQVSLHSSSGRVKRGWFSHMSLHGLASVMQFLLYRSFRMRNNF